MSPYMKRVRDALGSMLIEIPTVSVILRDDAGRVLLVHHTEGMWTVPGGMVEPLENPADAAVREAWEETGLHVRLTRVLGVYGGPEFRVRYRNGDEAAFLMTVFGADVCGGRERPDGDETLALRWFARDELADAVVPEWLPVVMRDVFEPAGATAFRPASWAPSGE